MTKRSIGEAELAETFNGEYRSLSHEMVEQNNAPTGNARDSLTSRILPQMTFSTGTSSSMTGPPPPMPHYLNAEGRAVKRFSVEGNAIFTGGGGTLALVCARALLEHGLTGLALLDLSFSAPANEQITMLRKDFPEATIKTLQIDVTDAEAVESSVEVVATRFGSVNILCCFAGIVGCTLAIDISAQEWRKTLDINTTGAFLTSQATAKQMMKQQTGGSIVMMASISAHKTNFPQPQAAYNASKAALLSMKSSLAAEWAVHGIRVNTISPGYMDTVLNEGEGLEEARRVWNGRNPMGRMGDPQELTGPLVLLCSAAGSYMTGMDLRVDGGQCCI